MERKNSPQRELQKTSSNQWVLPKQMPIKKQNACKQPQQILPKVPKMPTKSKSLRTKSSTKKPRPWQKLTPNSSKPFWNPPTKKEAKQSPKSSRTLLRISITCPRLSLSKWRHGLKIRRILSTLISRLNSKRRKVQERAIWISTSLRLRVSSKSPLSIQRSTLTSSVSPTTSVLASPCWSSWPDCLTAPLTAAQWKVTHSPQTTATTPPWMTCTSTTCATWSLTLFTRNRWWPVPKQSDQRKPTVIYSMMLMRPCARAPSIV